MDQKLFDWLKEDINKIENKINSIESKIDKLFGFNNKVIGGALLTSFIITLFFQIISLYVSKQ